MADLLAPVENGFFEAIAVSDAVNKVANSGPDIQRPGKAEQAASTQKKKADDDQLKLF